MASSPSDHRPDHNQRGRRARACQGAAGKRRSVRPGAERRPTLTGPCARRPQHVWVGAKKRDSESNKETGMKEVESGVKYMLDFKSPIQGLLGCARHGIRHGRRHHRQGPSPRTGRKRGTQSQAIGRSKGGITTKILALTDALGNLVRFVLLPGHRFDTVGVAPLIDGLAFEGFIADKAFDSNSIIADLNARGAKIVISQHPRRASPLPIDAEIYKWRHLIENFFGKLKEFKRIAMRADKTDQSFAANIHLAAAVINSR
jgi:transposase